MRFTTSKTDGKKQSSAMNAKNQNYLHGSNQTTLVLAMRLKQGQARSSTKIQAQIKVIVPTPSDILMGRGGGTNKNEGNRKYQMLIEERGVAYARVEGRNLKTQFAWAIYKQIRENGTRFLIRNTTESGWVEPTPQACRKKISQRLREVVLKAKEKGRLNTDTTRVPDIVQSMPLAGHHGRCTPPLVNSLSIASLISDSHSLFSDDYIKESLTSCMNNPPTGNSITTDLSFLTPAPILSYATCHEHNMEPQDWQIDF